MALTYIWISSGSCWGKKAVSPCLLRIAETGGLEHWNTRLSYLVEYRRYLCSDHKLKVDGIDVSRQAMPQIRVWWCAFPLGIDWESHKFAVSNFWVQWHRMTLSAALVNPTINPKLHTSSLKRDQNHVTDVCLHSRGLCYFI